ncbi:MAG: T9SS type A sorting domain-containing protein [Bacteroidetes bacterium]|nr:T9SS type A sorting domain-containing protein [Bacteroidota bacterium]
MKNFALLSIALLTSWAVNAQVQTVEEGFETWPTSNWDDYTIGAGNGWGQDWNGTSHSGAHSAHSYINNSQCDNWLVSPQVSISTNTYELKFWELNDDPEYFDNRTVHISTGSGNPSDGDFVEVITFVDTPTVWTETTFDLSSYQGEDIYVAFRYEGTWHKWFLDDVTIAPVSFIDGAITALVNPTGTGSIGVQTVQVEVTNTGTDVLNDIDIVWDVNGNVQVPYSTTSLNLASGASMIVNLGTYDFNTSGEYDISATLSTLGDFVSANNSWEETFGITTIKDGNILGVDPEAMTPITGLQDVSVIIRNDGLFTIDTTSVNWSVDGTSQTTFSIQTLNLAPGQTTELIIGQYNFGTGVYEIEATLEVLGDTTSSNDYYLAYAAVDTFWESMEGRIFPPENWSLDFGVLDNINFDVPPHGINYYTSMADDNYFGYVSDTLYTPVLDIETGDLFSFRLKTSGFQAAELTLISKNEATGAIAVLQTITNAQWESWLQQDLNISAAAGVNRIGIVTTPTGSYGTAKFDLFTSSASVHYDDNDLAITNGDLYFLARENVNEGFDCTIRNAGNLGVDGSAYTVKLMEVPGIELAATSGVTLSPFEDATITVNHAFSAIDNHRLYFEIEYAQDQNLSNNTYRSSDVHVVPNTIVIDEVGEMGLPSPAFPFDGGGNTNTLGQDDLTQTLYTADELPTIGNMYGMVYTYNNLVQSDETKLLPLKVWISQTGLTDLSGGWVPYNELTLVYDDTLEILPGNNREVYIPFDQPVMYSGLSNLVFQDYQYDPAWPPAVLRFYKADLSGNQSVRTIGVMDHYQLDPVAQTEGFFSSEELAYTQFVIDPITQLCEVSGTVYGTANLSLDGATVMVEGAGQSVITDINGNYTLPELPYGNYDLTASFFGYNDSTISVTLNNATLTQDFYLEERQQVDLLANVVGSNAPSTPLENVQVTAVGYTTDNGSTNVSGNVTMSNIFGVSEYVVSFSLYGYYDTSITVTVIDQNIDLGTVILEQEFISPFDVHISLGAEPIVKWKDPLKSDKVKIQNDYGANSHSYTNEPFENVFLGNYFGITDTTTITNVEFLTDVYLNAIDTVTIEIYDFDYQWVCSSKPFLIYPDSLHVIDVPNVVVYDSVFAMIHWQNNAASTNALVVDYSDTTILNSAVIGYPGQSIISLTEFFGNNAPNMSFLLRLHTLDDGNNYTNSEDLTYNVYRGLASEFPSLDNWEILNTSPLTSVSYPDVNWGGVDENQQYRYAVETIYTDGTSEVTFSNVIDGSWVGIEDLVDIASGITIYPIPTSGQITLSFDEDLEITGPITIYDALGQKVDEMYIDWIKGNTITKDLSNYNNGIYLFSMQTNGQTLVRNIVVAR